MGSLTMSPLFGNSNPLINVYSTWPWLSDLQAKSDDALKTLRLKRVEWAVTPTTYKIVSLKVTLSDDSTHTVGKSMEVDECFEFPDDRPVRAVEVGIAFQNIKWIKFIDADKEVIQEIKGRGIASRQSIFELNEGEQIIGIQTRESKGG